MTRRVVITGMGAVTCAGIGVATTWQRIAAGQAAFTAEAVGGSGAILPLGRIVGYEPSEHFDGSRLSLLDRTSQLAIIASREALGQAGAQAADAPEKIACVVGSGAGAAQTQDDAAVAFHADKKKRLHPLTIPKGMFSAVASQVAIEHGLKGPTLSVSSACSSAAHAIGNGFELIASGAAEAAMVGGAEACLTAGYLTAWQGMHILARQTCRPFSLGRDGLVLAEGAAMLFLEERERALLRNATILAEVVGFGASSDAGGITAPSADGMARAIHSTLDRAGLPPTAVAAVNAHGTGTEMNDNCESEALRAVFGDRLRTVPVSAIKSVTGHALGAAAAIELVAAVMTLREGFLPPTANFLTADPNCVVDCVPNIGRPFAGWTVLSNSFAFGGLNASILVAKA